MMTGYGPRQAGNYHLLMFQDLISTSNIYILSRLTFISIIDILALSISVQLISFYSMPVIFLFFF